MKKKLLAILLTLAMVVTMIPAAFVAVSAEESLLDYTAIDSASRLYEELNKCTDSTKSYKLKLTSDFTVTASNWVGIMDKYNVTIDGQGHTITVQIDELDDSVMGQATWPKFGVFASRSLGVWTIRNVNIEGSFTKTTHTTKSQGPEIGSVVGCAGGELNLENVHSSLNFTVDDQYADPMLGGLVGLVNENDYASIYASNCSYTGLISTNMETGRTGAFVGLYKPNAKGYGFSKCSSAGAKLNSIAFTELIGPTGGWMALPNAKVIRNFSNLQTMTSGYYYMLADIAVTAAQLEDWEPVGDAKIILEGNNHKITGLNYTQVEDSIRDDYTKPALLLKNAQNGSVFSRLTVQGYLTTDQAQSGMQMGGLVGCVCGKVSFADVVSDISVTEINSTGGAVGGFVGSASQMTQLTFLGCVNKGTVISHTGGRTGGFIGAGGFLTDAQNTKNMPLYIRFIDCVNDGAVKGKGDTGGLFGGDNSGNDASSANVTFIDCVNNGKVTAMGSGSAAGISCYLKFFIDYTAIGCVNNGAVTSDGAAAGLFRDMQSGSSILLKSCVNNGDVTSKAYGTGGVMSYMSAASITVDECINTATVSYAKLETATVGGVIGRIEGAGTAATVKNCANYGTVTSLAGYVGGILGSLEPNTTATVTGCYSFGEVYNTQSSSSEESAAGIVGSLNGAVTVDIDRCHNFGKVSANVNGFTKAGGILGLALDNTTVKDVEISNCSNFGVLEVYNYSGRGWVNDKTQKYDYSPEFGGIAGTCSGMAAGSTFTISYCYSNSVVIESAAAKAAKATHATDWNVVSSSVRAICPAGGKGTNSVHHCVAVAPALVEGGTLVATGFSALEENGVFAIDQNSSMSDALSVLNADGSGNAFVLDGGQLEPIYALNDDENPTQIYATQEANADEGNTVDIRVLALVNSLNYDKAGVELYKVGSTTPLTTQTTYTVYSGVLNGNNTVYAPFGTFYLPITMKNIDKETDFAVTIKTFVEKDGEKKYGDGYTLLIQDGKIVSKQKEERPANVIRFGSYNLHNGADVGHDFEVTAADILRYDLDIVGLQEVDMNTTRNGNQDTLAELSKYTGYQYYKFTKSINTSGGEYGTGILSKYPIESFSAHALPNGYNSSGTLCEARAFGHAVINVNGVKINYINTHLDHTTDSLIRTQYAYIVQYIADHNLDNVVITADFNTNDRALLKTLPGSALAFDESRNNVEGSFGSSTSQIDNVVFTADDFAYVDADVVKEFTHSDHYMIWADIAIK